MLACSCTSADAAPHTIVWAVYETSAQVPISSSEALNYFSSPLLSRLNFDATTYAAVHGLGSAPAALNWVAVTVDAYAAWTWA